MKVSVKKLVKTTFIIILLFVVISILKNIYLYNLYEHGNQALTKIDGQIGKIEGKWKGIFDTWQHGKDERHIFEYNFTSDNTGYFYYKFYYNRLDNKQSDTYSWEALLPFAEDDFKEYQSVVFIDSLYIVHIPDSNSLWQDTVYAQYKIKKDSLFIDRSKQDYPYKSTPVWGLEYSDKVALSKLIFPFKYQQ